MTFASPSRLVAASLIALSACARAGTATAGELSQMPPGAERDGGFIGWIKDVRGSVIVVDEESQGNSRRGEIYVASTTEIFSRTGMVVPASWLKRGQRVTVHFRGQVNATNTEINATADKIVIDM
jgi:hypothetical protein